MMTRYPDMLEKFKLKIYHYDDNVKLFLEKSLKSIDYLQNVPYQVKHELLYKMKKLNFEKDGFLFKIDDKATRMYIIQQGEVQIEHSIEEEIFAIEKLGRGCIINHRGFLFEDQCDTNARCLTTVTVFALETQDLEQVRENSPALDSSAKRVEKELFDLPNQIALDYILKFPKEKRPHRDWDVEVKRNKLTVQLKNAVMQMWLATKDKRKKPNFSDILKMIIKKRKQEAKDKAMGIVRQEEKEEEKDDSVLMS